MLNTLCEKCGLSPMRSMYGNMATAVQKQGKRRTGDTYRELLQYPRTNTALPSKSTHARSTIIPQLLELTWPPRTSEEGRKAWYHYITSHVFVNSRGTWFRAGTSSGKPLSGSKICQICPRKRTARRPGWAASESG